MERERLKKQLRRHTLEMVEKVSAKMPGSLRKFREVESWRYGRRYLQRWPGRKAMKAIREKIPAITETPQGLRPAAGR